MQDDAPKRFFLAHTDVLECSLMLGVLSSLFSSRDHAAVLVSERLPSTLVKLLKAMTTVHTDTPKASNAVSERETSSSSDSEMRVLGDRALELLGAAIAHDDVVQELMDSSTLHRLFYLSFPNVRSRQLAGLSVRLGAV